MGKHQEDEMLAEIMDTKKIVAPNLPKSEKLTVRERRFVNAYAQHGNATRAYKEAGYTVKNDNVAGREGHALKNKPKLQQALSERIEYLSLHNATMGKGEVVEEISRIAWSEDSSEAARLKALEMLGKIYGVFNPERQQQETSITINLTGDMPDKPTATLLESDGSEVQESPAESFYPDADGLIDGVFSEED